MQRLNRRARASCPRRSAFAFSPPAIPGVGTSGGVTFMLEDRTGAGRRVPRRATPTSSSPRRASGPSSPRSSRTFIPSVAAGLRRRRPRQGAQAGRRPEHGVQDAPGVHGRRLRELLQPLRTRLAGVRAGRGRVPDAGARTSASSTCATAKGEPVPLSALVTHGADVRAGVHDALQRVPERRRSTLRPKPGYSSGQGMAALEEVFARDACRREMGFDYIGHVVPGEGGGAGRARRASSSASRCSWCS